MTPKEKAEELFNKYISIDIQPYSEFGDYMINEAAKQCALIAVDFALEQVDGTLDEIFDKILYLTEVKIEIEEL